MTVYEAAFRPPDEYLTANGRYHWTKRARLTRSWREAAKVYARVAQMPPLNRAHIIVTFGFSDKRRRDVANLQPTAKAIVDGLVDAEVLPDDDDRHLVGPDVRRGWTAAHDASVVVTVIPLEPGDTDGHHRTT